MGVRKRQKRAQALNQEPAKKRELAGVVGIGASAGGIEAFRLFLENVPPESGLAYVLVQHLDPTRPSRLAESLRVATNMPVREVVDGDRVEADRVYVIPAGSSMRFASGMLRLQPRRKGRVMPIDEFFHSLANECGERAVGVVLSGTATDATDGLAAIRASGGYTFAQDPESARYDGMPRNAIEAGVVDFVRTPAAIAKEIVALQDGTKSSTKPESTAALATVLALLRVATGIDFASYKTTTIQRRLARRISIHRLPGIAEYAEFLKAHPNELASLYEDLLVHVTEFFRDPDTFEALQAKVFPEIVAHKTPGAPIRAWVAGCSTGEEAYSLAIALLEFLGTTQLHHAPKVGKGRPLIQIFGTDPSERAIAKARAGVYSEEAVKSLGEKRLRRFFTKTEDGYRIARFVREACVFVQHDLTNDPPFSRLDLVTCRNVLIYFGPQLQRKILPLFHYALEEPGFLVLGRTESPTSFGALFQVLDKVHKIYVRRPGASRSPTTFAPSALRARPVDSGKPEHTVAEPVVWREIDQALLDKVAPAAALLDDTSSVLRVRGSADRLVAVPSVTAALRSGVARARRSRVPVRHEVPSIKVDGRTRSLGIEIVPIRRNAPARDRRYLVLFDEVPSVPGKKDGKGPASGQPSRSDVVARELAATKEYLQSLVENQATTSDELTSANEELLSANEELQSTNEELETAKEELQSTNEELTTVNEELHHRNQDLNQLNNDLVNLLASIDICIVILDQDKAIRRFTPKARVVMNIIPTDVGRPFGDLKPNIEAPEIDRWIDEVIETVTVREAEVQDRNGRWFRLQIRPYKTTDNKIDGVVLSLVDIDQLIRSVAAAKMSRDFAASVIEAAPLPLAVVDESQTVISANHAFRELFRLGSSVASGMVVKDLSGGNLRATEVANLVAEVFWSGRAVRRVELSIEVRQGGARSILVSATPLLPRGERGEALLLLGVEDVTDREQGDQARARLEALEQTSRDKDIFLAMLSHELRTPLNSILLWSQILSRETPDRPTSDRAARAIERSAKVQSQLIDDLLDISRIVSGKLEVELKPVDLAPIVRNAAELARAEAEAKSLELTVAVDDNVPMVLGDERRLQQITWNLLANALKFTPKNGKVALRLSRVDDAGCRIEVSDDGVGIAPDFLPRIFDRFAQADSTLTRAHGGLGLGLAITRHLVMLHGGVIRASSPGEGQGSTFVVTIPAHVTGEAPGPATPRDILSSTRLSSVRVLIVDDDEGAREVISETLRRCGATVIAADSAAVARRAMEKETPDVLLCDIAMPVEDGVQFIREIRAGSKDLGTDVPAAALTAYAGSDERKRALAAGFDAHLTKPVDLERLVETVARLALFRRKSGAH